MEEADRPSWRLAKEERWENESVQSVPVTLEKALATTVSQWRQSLAAVFQVLAWWVRRPFGGLSVRAALGAGWRAASLWLVVFLRVSLLQLEDHLARVDRSYMPHDEESRRIS